MLSSSVMMFGGLDRAAAACGSVEWNKDGSVLRRKQYKLYGPAQRSLKNDENRLMTMNATKLGYAPLRG
jgi:hypothetical protein